MISIKSLLERICEDVNAKDVSLNHPAYNTKVKLPGYTSPILPENGHSDRDVARALLKNNPNWTREDHVRLAEAHDEAAVKLSKEWGNIADKASEEVFGRPFRGEDYQIGGIGSDKFSKKYKDALRKYAQDETRHTRLARGHEYASKMIRSLKSDKDMQERVYEGKREDAKKAMYDKIKKHGENLNKIFKTQYDDIILSKKLFSLENLAYRDAERYANGNIDTDEWEELEQNYLFELDRILNFKAKGIPVIISADPRGYALKIKNDYMTKNEVQLETDSGGYGILAPDFREG